MISDAALVRSLRRMLRVALTATAGLILVGVVLCFAHHPDYLVSPEDLAMLQRPGAARVNEWQVLRDAAALHGRPLALSGLMLLMVTPIVTVAATAVWFVRARQWPIAFVTLAVLALLLFSAVLGRPGG